MTINPVTTDEGHCVINSCESCGGDHEVIMKTTNETVQKKGFTHWFECPHKAMGGPVLLEAGKVDVSRIQ